MKPITETLAMILRMQEALAATPHPIPQFELVEVLEALTRNAVEAQARIAALEARLPPR
jgi:hypothetical protein